MDKTIEHQTTKATMKRRSTQQPLTRVDVWHLENVLFKLYRTIQSCGELRRRWVRAPDYKSG